MYGLWTSQQNCLTSNYVHHFLSLNILIKQSELSSCCTTFQPLILFCPPPSPFIPFEMPLPHTYCILFNFSNSSSRLLVAFALTFLPTIAWVAAQPSDISLGSSSALPDYHIYLFPSNFLSALLAAPLNILFTIIYILPYNTSSVTSYIFSSYKTHFLTACANSLENQRWPLLNARINFSTKSFSSTPPLPHKAHLQPSGLLNFP